MAKKVTPHSVFPSEIMPQGTQKKNDEAKVQKRMKLLSQENFK